MVPRLILVALVLAPLIILAAAGLLFLAGMVAAALLVRALIKFVVVAQVKGRVDARPRIEHATARPVLAAVDAPL